MQVVCIIYVRACVGMCTYVGQLVESSVLCVRMYLPPFRCNTQFQFFSTDLYLHNCLIYIRILNYILIHMHILLLHVRAVVDTLLLVCCACIDHLRM